MPTSVRLLTRRHMAKTFSLADDLPPLAEGLLLLCREIPLLLAGLPAAGACRRRRSRCRYPTPCARRLRAFARENNLAAVVTPDSDLGEESDRQLYLPAPGDPSRRDDQPGDAAIKRRKMSTRWPGRRSTGNDSPSGRRRWRRPSGWPQPAPSPGPQFGIVMPPWRGGEGREAAAVLREKAYLGAQAQVRRRSGRAGGRTPRT